MMWCLSRCYGKNKSILPTGQYFLPLRNPEFFRTSTSLEDIVPKQRDSPQPSHTLASFMSNKGQDNTMSMWEATAQPSAGNGMAGVVKVHPTWPSLQVEDVIFHQDQHLEQGEGARRRVEATVTMVGLLGQSEKAQMLKAVADAILAVVTADQRTVQFW